MNPIDLYDRIGDRLRSAGDWVAPLGLRLLLAWEFFSAGREKFGVGTEAPEWFANLNFPVPFGLLSANLNWLLVTWGELLAGVALVLGLFTRFFAFVLLVITTVAIVSVHWPASWDSLAQLWEGYSVSRVMDDGEFRGNFKIPMLILAMILPLLYWGGGKLSLDHLLLHLSGRSELVHERQGGSMTVALALGIPGLVLLYLIPAWGITLLVLAAIAALYDQFAG